jgi:adenylate cyclase, class 2
VQDLNRLESVLRDRGLELSVPVNQDDQAYAPDGWHYGMSKCRVSFARLRTEGGRHLFTLKRPTGPDPV